MDLRQPSLGGSAPFSFAPQGPSFAHGRMHSFGPRGHATPPPIGRSPVNTCLTFNSPMPRPEMRLDFNGSFAGGGGSGRAGSTNGFDGGSFVGPSHCSPNYFGSGNFCSPTGGDAASSQHGNSVYTDATRTTMTCSASPNFGSDTPLLRSGGGGAASATASSYRSLDPNATSAGAYSIDAFKCRSFGSGGGGGSSGPRRTPFALAGSGGGSGTAPPSSSVPSASAPQPAVESSSQTQSFGGSLAGGSSGTLYPPSQHSQTQTRQPSTATFGDAQAPLYALAPLQGQPRHPPLVALSQTASVGAGADRSSGTSPLLNNDTFTDAFAVASSYRCVSSGDWGSGSGLGNAPPPPTMYDGGGLDEESYCLQQPSPDDAPRAPPLQLTQPRDSNGTAPLSSSSFAFGGCSQQQHAGDDDEDDECHSEDDEDDGDYSRRARLVRGGTMVFARSGFGVSGGAPSASDPFAATARFGSTVGVSDSNSASATFRFGGSLYSAVPHAEVSATQHSAISGGYSAFGEQQVSSSSVNPFAFAPAQTGPFSGAGHFRSRGSGSRSGGLFAAEDDEEATVACPVAGFGEALSRRQRSSVAHEGADAEGDDGHCANEAISGALTTPRFNIGYSQAVFGEERQQQQQPMHGMLMGSCAERPSSASVVLAPAYGGGRAGSSGGGGGRRRKGRRPMGSGGYGEGEADSTAAHYSRGIWGTPTPAADTVPHPISLSQSVSGRGLSHRPSSGHHPHHQHVSFATPSCSYSAADSIAHAHFAVCAAAMQTPQTGRAKSETREFLDRELNSINISFRTVAPPLVTQLTETVFLGGFPGVETREALRALGVTHMVNCCAGQQALSSDEARGFSVSRINARDEPDYFILYHHFADFRRQMDAALGANQKVFVHCVGGVNRSVSLVTAYLMEELQLSPVEVVRRFRARGRNVILDNTGFRTELVDHYLDHCRPDLKDLK